MRTWLVVLLFCNPALIGLSFAPGLGAVAGYLRVAAIFIALGVVAMAIAIRPGAKASSGSSHRLRAAKV